MWITTETAIGTLRIIAEDDAVVAVDFLGEVPTGQGESRSTAHASARAQLDIGAAGPSSSGVLGEAVAQLEAYFDRRLKEFDLPLAPRGTPFQLRVWDELRQIGYGEVATYGAIAGRLGMSGQAARAVGLANGRNPIPVVIPCHRVVGANGSLTGYGGGIARKRTLLALEQGALF